MSLTEFKKELSALSGVDFFNPKFRNVFKKYCPNATTDNEEERLNEVLGEENETSTETTDVVETQEEKSTDEQLEEETKTEESSEDEEEQTEEGTDDSTSTEEEQNVEDENSDSDTESETSESESSNETNETETSEDDNQAQESQETNIESSENTNAENSTNELLETKVELQLVKSGVREDRLESAKKLFMSDIKSLEDLDKLKDLIKQYPEWLKKDKPNVKPFGMPVGDNDNALTAEEQRLKELGINPR